MMSTTQMAPRALLVIASLSFNSGCNHGDSPKANVGAGEDASGDNTDGSTQTGGIRQIAVGVVHTCALFNNGTVKCWGDNAFGQLADPTLARVINTSMPSRVSTGADQTTIHSRPISVPGLANVTQIAAGNYHTCAVLGDRTVRCWGNGAHGQIADESLLAHWDDGHGDNGLAENGRYSPKTVSGLTDVVQVSAGWNYTCAVRADTTARCWGCNWTRQLGINAHQQSTDVSTPEPLIVGTGRNFWQIATTQNINSHTCAVFSDGTMGCWGFNNVDRLNMHPGLAGVQQIVVSHAYICALLKNGTVVDWSYDESPTVIPEFQGATQIAIGYGGLYALTVDGSVKRLYGGKTSNIQELSNVRQLSGGPLHMCALLADDAVKCWGDNRSGQLGDGTTTDRSAPTLVVF